MSKYLKVMFDNKGVNFEYKIDEVLNNSINKIISMESDYNE